MDYKKAFDVTLSLFIEGLYRGPLYMNIEGRGVYKVTTICVRWLSLTIKFSLETSYLQARQREFLLVTHVLYCVECTAIVETSVAVSFSVLRIQII